MAQSQAFVNTGSQSGLRESLKNFIARVAWEDTPFLTSCGKTDAKAVAHSWVTENLADAAANTNVSGFAVTFAAADANLRSLVTNQVQVLKKVVQVDKTMEWVDKVGLGTGSEYDHQIQIKSKELALDLDRALLVETVTTRADDTQTAGVMRGLIAATTSSVKNLAGASEVTFDAYLDLCETIASRGGKPDMAIMNGKNKLVVDSWSAGRREWNIKDTEIAQDVEIIRSGFSVQSVLFDKHMPKTDIVLFQQSMNYVAYGRPFEFNELKPDADTRGGYVVTEATLEHRNEASGGKISGIKS